MKRRLKNISENDFSRKVREGSNILPQSTCDSHIDVKIEC